MLYALSSKIVEELIEKEKINKESKEVALYGIEMTIELLINIISTITLGLMFGLVFESIIFLIMYSFIRTSAGGYHCEKMINCYLLSCGIIILTLSTVKFFPQEYMLIAELIILMISVPTLLNFVPLDTKTRIYDEAEKEHYKKKTIKNLTLEIIMIIALCMFNMPTYAFIVSLAIFISSVLVLVQKLINSKNKEGL